MMGKGKGDWGGGCWENSQVRIRSIMKEKDVNKIVGVLFLWQK
jgi:hypothetical protein